MSTLSSRCTMCEHLLSQHTDGEVIAICRAGVLACQCPGYFLPERLESALRLAGYDIARNARHPYRKSPAPPESR